MAHASHQGTVIPRVVTLTISDTRTAADDTSGAALRTQLQGAGFTLGRHILVRDDIEAIQQAVREVVARGEADAVIATGGTGIAPRDQTIEALTPLLDKTLDGFGEAFRRLSWDEIGPRSILSRAVAGTVGRVVVIALPGSTNAVRLGVTRIIAPVLPHAVALLAV